MKQRKLSTCLFWCWLLVSAWLLPSAVFAQGGTTQVDRGDAVMTGLSVVNSIIWDNVFENEEKFANSYNLVNEDPLFASAAEFFPTGDSPALGTAIRTANDLKYDIAGFHYENLARLNIGAFQSGAFYTVTIDPLLEGGTLIVYHGSETITSPTDFPAGTELKVVLLLESGYSLESLTANGRAITNGATFIVTSAVTFAAELEESASIRGEKYATYATATSLKSFNNIIFDNIDVYGNYTLDRTTVVANPTFQPGGFTIGEGSAAQNAANAAHLPQSDAPYSDLAGLPMATTGQINAGAFQSNTYTLSWTDPAGGTLAVYYMLKNESNQAVKTVAENGGIYPNGEVRVEVSADAGYTLTAVQAGGSALTIDKEGKGSFTLATNAHITATFRSLGESGVLAAVLQNGSLALQNNIVWQNAAGITAASKTFGTNLPVSTNVGGQTAVTNLIDTDPVFITTNFRLQSTSPAINKGTEYAFGDNARDVAGADRVRGGVVDMGAYESGVNFEGYAVTFNWNTNTFKDAKNKDYARMVVMAQTGSDDPVEVTHGNKFPEGTVITVTSEVYADYAHEYVVTGLIKAGDDYVQDGVFTLEKDTRVEHNIQKRKYPVHYTATGGTIRLYNGNVLVADGEEVAYGTILSVLFIAEAGQSLQFVAVDGQHIKGAEQAGGYMVTVKGETTIVASGMDATQTTTHGLIVWDDIVNATVTAKLAGTETKVNSGDALEPGTVVDITVAPTSEEYGYLLFQLNGADQSLARTSFSVTIEAGATTFIAVRCGTDGEPAKGIQTNPDDKYFPDDVTFTDDVVFEGDTEFGGDATFKGEADFTNPDGETIFEGDVIFHDEADFKGDVTFNGDVTFEKGADFAKEPEFNGDVTITGEINLPTDGGITIGDDQTLTIDGEATVNGDLTINGGTLTLGELTVDGTLTLADATIKATEGASLKADEIINGGSGKNTIDIVQSLQQGSNSPVIILEFAPGTAPTEAEINDLFDVTVAGSDRDDVTYEWHQYGDSWILEAKAEEPIEIINGDPVYDDDVVFDEEVIFTGNPTFNGDATFNDEAEFQGDVIFGGENTTFTEDPVFGGDVTIGGNITLPAPDGSLTIGDDQTLTIGEGGATVTGDVTIDGGTLELGNLTVDGELTLNGGATLVVSPDATIDAGSITGSTSPKSVIDLSRMPVGEYNGLTVGVLSGAPGDLFMISTGGGANYSWKDNGGGSYTLTVTRTEPATPDPDAPVYVTLTIPDALPEGITINPGPGEYQVLEGASKLLKLLIDEKYEDSYVFLRINGDYVMVKSPAGELEFSYMLLNIREALTIEVIISTTANPEEGTVGNVTLTPGVRVTGESGKLRVESDRVTKVLVYTISGKLVVNSTVNGTKEFSLPAGIYIVRTASTSVKAAVR